MKSKNASLIVLILSVIFIGLCIFTLFPKHNQTKQASTISWDASGYYFYLPAIFIYNDLKHLNFKDSIIKKYAPTPQLDQAFKVENGNYVCKYSCGMAIQYLPSFLIGHLITKYFTKYPPDGFSKPYHFSIALGSFLISILGLSLMRKILLRYYSDKITAITLLTLILGSNYFNYTAFDGAMSHNYLFSLYALIIYFTIQFYENPTVKKSILIGLFIGLTALTRPTEIITCLIPLLWGVNVFSKQSRIERLNLIKQHKIKFLYAVLACFLIGSLQLIYWKYVSGHWIIYSYQDQGFSWLKPHILDGLFSLRGGWLIYTPIMFFAIVGIYLMKKTESVKPLISLILIFTILYIYIAFAWDIWWYGGSLGQRTMVQSYALLCIPLASFFEYLFHKKWLKFFIAFFWILFLYINLWWTWNYHMGGYYWVDGKNPLYFWHVLGKWNYDENDLKLLDNNEGTIPDFLKSDLLYINNFEQDSSANSLGEKPIEGTGSYCIDQNVQYTPEFCFKPTNINYQYFRITASFKCIQKSSDFERYAQFLVRFKDHTNQVKLVMLRVERNISQGETKLFYLDSKVPKRAFDEICIQLWNGDGNNRILIDELKVEGFITK